jgi:hypothetical protein
LVSRRPECGALIRNFVPQGVNMNDEAPSQENESGPILERAAPAKVTGPTFAQPEQRIADLSSEIVKVLPRGVGERITCRRIIGDHYRCNWWSPQESKDTDGQGMTGLAVTTQRVSKSQFLHVTRAATGLAITLMPGGPA